MSGWTKEPWVLGGTPPHGMAQWVYDGHGEIIATVANRADTPKGQVNAERIVACVNALAGIPSPDAALRELVEAAWAALDARGTLVAVSQRFDRLRAALQPFAALAVEPEEKR